MALTPAQRSENARKAARARWSKARLAASCDALIEVLTKAFAGMPCSNRETAAEKAAAHKWMEEERKRNPARKPQTTAEKAAFEKWLQRERKRNLASKR